MHSLVSLVQGTKHLDYLLPAANNVVGLLQQLIEDLRFVELLQEFALQVFLRVID